MYRYVPFAEVFYSNDIGKYRSFGIIANDMSGREVARVSDISVDEIFVNELCRRFNANQLSPIHLLDVIEDALS